MFNCVAFCLRFKKLYKHACNNHLSWDSLQFFLATNITRWVSVDRSIYLTRFLLSSLDWAIFVMAVSKPCNLSFVLDFGWSGFTVFQFNIVFQYLLMSYLIFTCKRTMQCMNIAMALLKDTEVCACFVFLPCGHKNLCFYSQLSYTWCRIWW